ncbi:alpha/beta-hydrolase [Mollisia scopiformis]|uniref:Carboxylic ester hydrolase n=1 Tax=Mollisia scopiformis TaxID=149040 RepID=A0A194WU21_MOLSC|nr:alpha/beta-hydrolase [Mollisia scopiformis]KUJ11453.1 alpha/beta-hydrolase [Mollisia scopiformis]
MVALNILFAISFCYIVEAAPPVKRAANPTVTVPSLGTVIGTATSVINQPTVTGLVNAYLGVPFASPPERFSPASAQSAWPTPIVAQISKPACIQQFSGTAADQAFLEYLYDNPGGPPPEESEDCLYLNIFAPQDASSSNAKAVMFWIYGGAPQFGWEGDLIYNGSSLAVNHDVVVVASGYRNNIFGYPNSPELSVAESNLAFLDQRLALQWVHDNINAFGGDPDQVMIFGESSGGYAVKQLLALPPDPLPYASAIMESEAASAGANSTGWDAVAAEFGCTTAASQLECMRGISATEIKTYISDNSLSFLPGYDGVTCADSSTIDAAIEAGTFAKVPFLIGTNSNEGTPFVTELDPSNGATVVEIVYEVTGLNISLLVDALTSIYGSGIIDTVNVFASQVITDLVFTCPTASLFTLAANNGYDVWRYYYNADIPNEQKFTNAGAWHSSEIPQVWGTYSTVGATTAQIQLSSYMQGVWSGFAKNPSAGPGWTRYGTSLLGLELGVIGGLANPTGEVTVLTAVADYACVILDTLDEQAGLSKRKGRGL